MASIRSFGNLIDFLSSKSGLGMSHIYKPVKLLSIMPGGGKATKREIAEKFLLSYANQLEYYSRECLLQVVDFSIGGKRLTGELDRLAEQRGLPAGIVMDNGPELTSKATFFWSKRTSVKLHFIQPGKPILNAFVESFNGKFRDYCLDLHWFASLADAREEIDSWRDHYNHVRPHRSLGKKPPSVFARQAA